MPKKRFWRLSYAASSPPFGATRARFVAVSLSRAETERALVGKLGLQLDRRDHRVYRLYVGERFVLRTMVSTGSGHRTLGAPLVAAMAKQLRIDVADLRAIVGCTIDRAGYLQRLRDAGVLDREETIQPS